MIADIVRAAAVDGNGGHWRKRLGRIGRIANAHAQNLHGIVRRDKRGDLRLQPVRAGDSLHGLPHKAGRQRAGVLRRGEFLALGLGGNARGRPAARALHTAPEVARSAGVVQALDGCRLQQKGLLIELAVPAEARRHRAFQAGISRDGQIEPTGIFRVFQRKNTVFVQKTYLLHTRLPSLSAARRKMPLPAVRRGRQPCRHRRSFAIYKNTRKFRLCFPYFCCLCHFDACASKRFFCLPRCTPAHALRGSHPNAGGEGIWRILRGSGRGFGAWRGCLPARYFLYKSFMENSYGNAILILYKPLLRGIRKSGKRERPLWNCAATSNC